MSVIHRYPHQWRFREFILHIRAVQACSRIKIWTPRGRRIAHTRCKLTTSRRHSQRSSPLSLQFSSSATELRLSSDWHAHSLTAGPLLRSIYQGLAQLDLHYKILVSTIVLCMHGCMRSLLSASSLLHLFFPSGMSRSVEVEDVLVRCLNVVELWICGLRVLGFWFEFKVVVILVVVIVFHSLLVFVLSLVWFLLCGF